MSLITKFPFLSIGKRAVVCHRVGKDDKKFHNNSKDDDCHHGDGDNYNNYY
jgi:hypothetical protein